MTAMVALDEIDRFLKALQAPRLIERGRDAPRLLKDKTAGTIGGAQKDPEPQIARRIGGGLEFSDRFGPLAIVERCDGRR